MTIQINRVKCRLFLFEKSMNRCRYHNSPLYQRDEKIFNDFLECVQDDGLEIHSIETQIKKREVFIQVIYG